MLIRVTFYVAQFSPFKSIVTQDTLLGTVYCLLLLFIYYLYIIVSYVMILCCLVGLTSTVKKNVAFNVQ
jgi:hypothetical protein